MLNQQQLEIAMQAAIAAAYKFYGATSPNPAVGAAAIDAEGQIIALAAHERAGTAHAEAKLLADLRATGEPLNRVHALLITLEPCNHHGRTPPCTEAIIVAGIKNIYFGTKDPNPSVAGNGAKRLQEAGIQVTEGICEDACKRLVRSFSHHCRTGRPWLIVKQALNHDGSMLPPTGQKTFTNPESLLLAHELRRSADAILTGSGTILADNPLFTVRHVPDFTHKRRWLLIFDRRNRVPSAWREQAAARGFQVSAPDAPYIHSLSDALEFLGSQGCLEALVEAGPSLTKSVLESGLWNEHVVIQHGKSGEDQITRSYNNVYRNH